MFVICLRNDDVFVLQVARKKFQQEYDIALPITFDGDHIALDIPDVGVQTDNGWEIVPVHKARVSSNVDVCKIDEH